MILQHVLGRSGISKSPPRCASRILAPRVYFRIRGEEENTTMTAGLDCFECSGCSKCKDDKGEVSGEIYTSKSPLPYHRSHGRLFRMTTSSRVAERHDRKLFEFDYVKAAIGST